MDLMHRNFTCYFRLHLPTPLLTARNIKMQVEHSHCRRWSRFDSYIKVSLKWRDLTAFIVSKATSIPSLSSFPSLYLSNAFVFLSPSASFYPCYRFPHPHHQAPPFTLLKVFLSLLPQPISLPYLTPSSPPQGKARAAPGLPPS